MDAKDKKMLDAANLLKVIANPVRLRILCELEKKKMSVGEIQVCVKNISQPAISQHLSVLKAHRILVDNKSGQQVFYTIANNKVIDLMKSMREIFCKE